MKSRNEVWRLTDYESGDERYFCQEACAESFTPMGGGDWGDPENVTTEKIEEAQDEEWKCDFCQQLIVREEQ